MNASHDADTEYLSEGITEVLIDDLTEIENLRVIPRASAFRFKGTSDLRGAAAALHVQALITGRVLRHGDALSVQADLIDIREDRQLWGGRYVKRMSDLVTIQSEIARDISDHLRLRISSDTRRRVIRPPTTIPAAFDAYLKGRYFWNKRTADDLRKSIEYFRQAIDIDPNYALAYAGIADAYQLLGYHGSGALPPDQAMPQAKAAADKSLELDPNLAEAHVSKAGILMHYDWTLPAAEAEFRRGLALNPNYPTGHQWLAFSLVEQQKFDDGLAEMKKAQELDPLSMVINANVSWMNYFARRYAEGEREALRSREVDPSFYATYWVLGMIHTQMGRHAEAIADGEHAVALTNRNVLQRARLAHALAAGGRTSEARAELNEILQIAHNRYVPPYVIALVYIALGD